VRKTPQIETKHHDVQNSIRIENRGYLKPVAMESCIREKRRFDLLCLQV
jgi:hypothetical protein